MANKQQMLLAMAMFSALVLAIVPVAFALPNFWLEPLSIPTGEEVTLHITATSSWTFIRWINVTNPEGTVWTWNGDMILPDVGDEVSIIFPSGQAQVENDPDGDVVLPVVSWSSANTNIPGEYEAGISGLEMILKEHFDVFGSFNVPELGFIIPLATSIGFIGYVMLRRRPKAN